MKTVSYGGSPPLATRTGWMAIALLPFVIALSSKANYITALTGVPHEKLQVSSISYYGARTSNRVRDFLVLSSSFEILKSRSSLQIF
jgi:hypothetical protein